jgi:glycosyltransferase involved in cell wall biosynthesis
MEGFARPTGQPAGAFTSEAVAGLRALSAGVLEPFVLGYHPVARLNPFQHLLYGHAWRQGIAPVQIVRRERIKELVELSRVGIPTILHLHWLNQIVGGADSLKEAARDRAGFLREIDAYLAAGGHLAWTVHNVLPHGSRFEDEEAGLRADIAERCDAIHVMAPGTPAHVEPWYHLPADKLIEVPHPSYAGAYQDVVSREQARHELGVMPDEIVHVALGVIKPYKGVNELLDAWDVAATDGVPRRLIVAGEPSDEPGIAEALERVALHPTAILHARRIPADEMQLFLRAADVAVMPYRRSLNSGAQMLALTFGVPVVVPGGGGLADVVDERAARFFDGDDPDSLAGALRAADELVTPAARAAARSIADAVPPAAISERFATQLRARVSGVPASS